MPKQNEAQYITERLVKTYGLWFKVTKKIATPDFWVYMLARRSDQKVGDLHAVADALADDIFAYRNDGKPVTITAITQPPHIQVSRSQRAILPWAANVANVKPFVAVLGAYWLGPEPQKLAIDFSSDDYAVGAFFGSQGSGKSTLLHIALLGLCRSTPPELVEVYAIDLKKGSFSRYEHLPHVRFTARAEAEALDLLRWLESLCYADTAPSDGKLRILFADELQMLVADSLNAAEFLQLIQSIMQLGREFGIRVLSATQNPNAANYPPSLKPLTHYMGAGRTRVDSYLRSQMKIEGARHLLGKGDFIFDCPNGSQRFKSFWLGETERDAEVAKLLERWGADPEVIHFITAEEANAQAEEIHETDQDVTYIEETVGAEVWSEPQPQTEPEPVTVAAPARKLTKAERKLKEDAEAIAPFMADAWDPEYEEIRSGYGVQLIAAIYGEKKPNAGPYARRMKEAVNHYLSTIEPTIPTTTTEEGGDLVWMLPYDGN